MEYFCFLDSIVRGLDADSSPVDFRLIGKEMLTYYSPALVVIGLTLAGSIIGALALARREDISQKDERTS